MARNKYPEATVEKILEVSKRLFLEKGYENTTIQDIVNELNGLTKGAIYHHFKSKEEIIDALGDNMFFESNPFSAVKNRNDLNALQKMKMIVSLNHSDHERMEISKQSIPILENPRIFAGIIESNRRLLSPLWYELIEEGNQDGSIHTEYAKELSELIPYLEFWLLPTIFPATPDEQLHKIYFMKKMLESMGLPLFDDELMDETNDIAIQLFSEITAPE